MFGQAQVSLKSLGQVEMEKRKRLGRDFCVLARPDQTRPADVSWL